VTWRRKGGRLNESGRCVFPQVGCRFLQVPADLAVIVDLFAGESKYWANLSPVCRSGIGARQEALKANPQLLTTLAMLARLSSDGRLCQTQLDVVMHACTPGQPQPLL